MPAPPASPPVVLLPLIVLFVSETLPELVEMPPPLAKEPVVLLPLTVLLVSVSVPSDSNRMAPPPLADKPPMRVRLEIVRSPVVLEKCTTCESCWASIVTF